MLTTPQVLAVVNQRRPVKAASRAMATQKQAKGGALGRTIGRTRTRRRPRLGEDLAPIPKSFDQDVVSGDGEHRGAEPLKESRGEWWPATTESRMPLKTPRASASHARHLAGTENGSGVSPRSSPPKAPSFSMETRY